MNNLKVIPKENTRTCGQARNKFFRIKNLEDFAYAAMKWRSNFREENF